MSMIATSPFSKDVHDRFMTYVRKSPRCWMWTGNRPDGRYGHFKIDGKTHAAHRVAYQMFVGALPNGAWVLHKCDNPGCVRPEHLFEGNARLNVLDKIAKKRGGAGSLHGRAKISEADAIFIRETMNNPDRPRGTMVSLCRRFNLSTTSIQRIARGAQFIYLDR